MRQWRPMSEAPRDGTWIVAIYDGGNRDIPVCVRWLPDDTYPWSSHDNAYPESRIEGWLPVPGKLWVEE